MWAGLLLIRHPALFICAQGDAVERILLEAARANTAHDVVLAAPKQACLCFLLCAQGGAVERILLEAARANTAHDVVLCIGDDRSDEDMYTAIEHVAVMPHLPAEVWGP
jgi:trehalose-6-phosphatase